MNRQGFFSAFAKTVSGALLIGCECAAAPSLPPPKAEGAEVVTLQIQPPAGTDGRRVFAALKRDGRIVARGKSAVGTNGVIELVLRALDKETQMPTGTHDLWVVIDRDGLAACHPSFGDWCLRDTWPKSGRYDDPAAWKQKPPAQPENLVTIHYHRYDEDYDDVGIWSWDANYKKSPEQNELLEVGRDDFGLVFQLDGSEYGSDKIGLVPRLHADWSQKDGDDKFWTPDMGKEVYLVGTKEKIWTAKPDIKPQVVAAHIDARDRLVVQLSRPLQPSQVSEVRVKVVDRTGKAVAVAGVRLTGKGGKSNGLDVTLSQPLDVVSNTYTVAVGGFAETVVARPRGILNDPALFCDTNAVLGASYTPKATTFRVFAPAVAAVNVVLYHEATGNAGRRLVPMASAGKGIWEARVGGDLAGNFYLYGLDEREVLDIYAINTVDSSRRARITDLSGTGTVPAGPRVASPVDMIIYEMHVRDFTIAANSAAKPEHRGKYLGFIEAADHLKELGATHVQLLPLQDFENDETSTNYGWGYVTTAFNSPDGWFASNPNDDSRIREFKQLVAALHERGIGVIMDVVYNHTSNNAPFNLLVPRYYFRFLPDGSYANGSGCGNDFRTEAPMARKYIVDSLKYWVTEYGIDGFRFDLMALIDLDTMKEVENELRAIRPDVVLYGEPWAGGGASTAKSPTNKQAIRGTHLGAFNDDIRNALVGSPFERTRGGFIQDGSHRDELIRGLQGQWRSWGDGPYQVINYMSCHDNYVVYDKLKASKPGASHQDILEMMKLGYLLLFTAQGVPFIHGGEEFARTKQGHENSYNAPDDINEVNWSLKQTNADLFTYVRDLIALRKAHPVFRLRAKEQIAAWLKFPKTGDPNVLMYTYDAGNAEGEPWKQVCVIVNAADSGSAEVKLPDGVWQVAFDHTGTVTEPRPVQDTVRVRYKSGMILYQL